MSAMFVAICALAAYAFAAEPTLSLPLRPANAMNGTQLHDYFQSMSKTSFETAVYREFFSGNIPDSLRQFKPIDVTRKINGKDYHAVYYVLPDYICLGSDEDNYHMPMAPVLAQRICNATGTTLPTRKMVNDIWNAAVNKPEPQPIPPDADMVKEQRFWEHEQLIRPQLATTNITSGTITAGHKKDVVITMRMNESFPTPRLFIYGWHKANGTPIQDLSAAHQRFYVDYSHGIRLVSNTMTVNDETTTVQSILCDKELWELLSDEGPYNKTALAYPVLSEH